MSPPETEFENLVQPPLAGFQKIHDVVVHAGQFSWALAQAISYKKMFLDFMRTWTPPDPANPTVRGPPPAADA